MTTLTLANPNAAKPDKVKMLGFRFLFGTLQAKTFHLGYVRNPAENPTKTDVEVQAATNGPQETVATFTTGYKDVFTFETTSAGDPGVRYLHAGAIRGWVDDSDITAFATAHAYAEGDYVRPTVANGHYYVVTVAGTSEGSAPTWETGAASETVSGGVTFTEVGAYPVVEGIKLTPTRSTPVNGIAIQINPNAISDGLGEIKVYPSAQLIGDGYAAGRDGASATALKFTVTALESSGFVLPTSITDTNIGTAPVDGGFALIDVPNEDLDSIAADILAAFYATL